MAFSFLHRPSRKRGKSSWYENALLLAVAGSIIALVGQLAGTIIPIMYGPEDASDFSVSLSSNWVQVDSNVTKLIAPITVTVEDLHPHLRRYKYGISLRTPQVLPLINVTFKLRQINLSETSTKTSEMDINFDRSLEGVFPIIIQGVGGNGKTRNTTFYLELW